MAADAAGLRERAASRTSSTGRPTSRGTPPATSTSPTGSATTRASRSSTRTGSSSDRGVRPGPANGQFRQPRSIAIDAQGLVYVADAGNRRIQVFDGDGNFKTQFLNVGTPRAICITSGPRQVMYVSNSNPPEDIDVDGEIYKVDLTGKLLGTFGHAGQARERVQRCQSARMPHRERDLGGGARQLARVEDHSARSSQHELDAPLRTRTTETRRTRRWILSPCPLCLRGPFPPMSPLVFSSKDVERLLSMRECITVMEQAFTDLQRGFLHHPLRTFWAPPGVNGGTMWMAAYRSSPKPMFGTKLLFVLNDNPSRGLDSHQGQVILADGETGELRALLDASTVTAIRTAAVSALATRLLAREDATRPRDRRYRRSGAEASRIDSARPASRACSWRAARRDHARVLSTTRRGIAP